MFKGALPGFRDFYPQELAERAFIMNAWRSVARRYAFVEYDGPPLEPLDLYTRKSGAEIVGQLYNFVDKGGRDVALRPEMTPTVARMVGAKANALRKPVRWFSLPQLFRYERAQRGRLREHFQLNVDIVGEADVTADAELLAVAIEIMREVGLGPEDVRARVSDRRLLRGLLRVIGAADDQIPAIFGAIDKIERRPAEVTREALAKAGLSADAIQRVVALTGDVALDALETEYGADAELAERFAELRRYQSCLQALGIADWVKLDLKIVRGLAYYTGIVFELFDAKGELRAICGGGRYDTLLSSLGSVDLPALGFGMGDVVLTELLRERGLLPTAGPHPQVWVAAEAPSQQSDVRRAATALRRIGVSVEYALRDQPLMKQVRSAKAAGAEWVLTLHLAGRPEAPPEPHSWKPDAPPDWNRAITEIGL